LMNGMRTWPTIILRVRGKGSRKRQYNGALERLTEYDGDLDLH
jgi:hypothetical protein